MQGIKARLFVVMITSVFLAGLTASAAAADPEEWNWTSISAGSDYACATLLRGSRESVAIHCAGVVPAGPGIDRISADVWSSTDVTYRNMCSIRTSNSELKCWGEHITGLWDGPWRSVSVGYLSVCAIKVDGTLWCWGSNVYGQLGIGRTDMPPTFYETPQPVDSSLWKQVSVGGTHACGIKTDNTLWCWGDNSQGQVGDGTGGSWPGEAYNVQPEPTEIFLAYDGVPAPTNLAPILVEAGPVQTCAISERLITDWGTYEGILWCWGDNVEGVLGDGSTLDRYRPGWTGHDYKSISLGLYAACGLKTDSSLWCWGTDGFLAEIIPGWFPDNRRWMEQHQASGGPYLSVSVGTSTYDDSSAVCVVNDDQTANCIGRWDSTYDNFDGRGWIGGPIWFDQEITFASIADRRINNGSFAVTASATSGLPVTIRSNTPDVCSIANGMVGLLAVGTCTLTADQDGDGRHNAAPAVTRTFAVRKIDQAITFNELTAKTVLAAPFTIAASTSSGLPVSFSSDTTAVCTVSSTTVTIVDIGTCTITASNIGDAIYAGADSVSRSFSITRVLASNKTVTFVDPDGTPAVGVSVSWATPDGRYQSSKAATTNAAGQITYTSIPGGQVRFSVSGTVGAWWTENGPVSATVPVSAASTRVTIGLSSAAEMTDQIIVHVRMPDGSAVPNASVWLGGRYGFQINDPRLLEEFCLEGSWTLIGCRVTNITDLNGNVTFNVIANVLGDTECLTYSPGTCTDPYGYATATLSDGDITQTSAHVQFSAGEATITLDQLPVVNLLADDALARYASRQFITALALDATGEPITGRKLTLSSSVTGATLSSCKSTLTSTTNSVGRVTFTFCPIKTATWSADGTSIVRSKGVRITVMAVPSVPLAVVAARSSKAVSLTWKAPALINAGKVTDYVVQYRLAGAATWVTFKDGTSTSLKTTVTRLKAGQAYEFRVAAKNSAGTSDWSSVVVATPR